GRLYLSLCTSAGMISFHAQKSKMYRDLFRKGYLEKNNKHCISNTYTSICYNSSRYWLIDTAKKTKTVQLFYLFSFIITKKAGEYESV
ncbi:hypothetical protein ACFL1A_00230, partial [Patescibacteria group bacterium]